MRLALLGLLAVAACDPGDRRHDAAPDATGPDAYVCTDQTPYVPVGVSGTSPAGSLTSLRYLSGLWYPCGLYEVRLAEGTRCEEGLGHELLLSMVPDVTTAGAVVSAAVRYGELEAMAWFHILRLDSEAIIGSFVVNGAGWSLELEVDVQPGYSSCTL